MRSQLTNAAGSHIYRPQFPPARLTLDVIIERDQRAIVTFHKNNYLRDAFVPGVEHRWANTDNITVLRVSFERYIGTDPLGPMHPEARVSVATSGFMWLTCV